MDQLLTTALVSAAVAVLASVKPAFSAYMGALERKANQLYKDAPVEATEEERKKFVRKALGRSMIGASLPASVLQGVVDKHEHKEDPPK